MIAKINCSECGHDKGHTLEHVGHEMLAECTNCDHVNDVLIAEYALIQGVDKEWTPITKQTLIDFYNEE
jgi:uncharacterized Zn finger protein